VSAVLTFPTTQPTLNELVDAWAQSKREEDAANAKRLAIEAQICELSPPKEEGATTVELAGGAKVTLTGKLTYRLDDLEALRNITAKWDANIVPLKTNTELDATGCKWLRANRPDLWKEVASVITVTPAKTSVKVGF
jgi:hypothetical protein